MGKPPRSGDWKKRAAAARQTVRLAKRGARSTALQGAVATDQNENTLRREIFALDFLDEVRKSHPALRRQLDKLSFSLVELLARWSAFDPDRAIEAAAEAVEGGYTVKTLTKAIGDARKGNAAALTAHSYREDIEEEVTRVIRSALDGDVWKNELNPSEEPADRAIDFRYCRNRSLERSGASESIAAVIVGPYSDPSLYRKRERDWLLKAFGLSFFYDHVVLLLDEGESYRQSLQELQKHLSARYERVPSILVLHLSVPRPPKKVASNPSSETLAPEDEVAIGKLGAVNPNEGSS